MARIKHTGQELKPGTGLLRPHVLDPRSFMKSNNLEINWEALRMYMNRHQTYHREMRKIRKAQGIYGKYGDYEY
jgi:hypothetical protein